MKKTALEHADKTAVFFDLLNKYGYELLKLSWSHFLPALDSDFINWVSLNSVDRKTNETFTDLFANICMMAYKRPIQIIDKGGYDIFKNFKFSLEKAQSRFSNFQFAMSQYAARQKIFTG